MMKMNKMQNMTEMMSKMSESERMKMAEEMMGMCMCHDCSTLKDCNMNMDCSMMSQNMMSQKGLFCGMSESSMPNKPMTQDMKCKCTSCSVASDMGMSMMNFPCMSKK